MSSADPLITRIQPLGQRGLKVLIHLDEGEPFELMLEALERSRIGIGDALPANKRHHLLDADANVRVRHAAFNLLSYRARTHHELRRRLRQKGFHPARVDACLDLLQERGFLDDEAVAAAFVRDRLRHRPRGKVRLSAELRAKGIAPEMAERAIEQVFEDEDVTDHQLAEEVAQGWVGRQNAAALAALAQETHSPERDKARRRLNWVPGKTRLSRRGTTPRERSGSEVGEGAALAARQILPTVAWLPSPRLPVSFPVDHHADGSGKEVPVGMQSSLLPESEVARMSRVSRYRLLRVSLTTAATFLLSAPAAPPLAAQTAREIIDRVDRMMRGESSHGRVTMDITTEHWSRSLDMEVWSLGTEHSLVRVESPAREAGTATLRAGEEVWNYLPRVDRTIKVPPALMMGAWMGSHFTNDDLVKESRIVDDYDFEISFEGEIDGVEVYEFTMTPKPEAPVVWGRVEEQVRKHDLMPTWVRYYDDDGTLVRTLTFSDYKIMSGRLVPAVMLIVPADKPEEKTSMTYHELEFDIDIDESFFSLRTLRARR